VVQEAGPSSRKRAILAAHPVFSSLPDALLGQLSEHARTTEYPAGTQIFAKGDPGHALFIVLDGAVKISVPSNEGREIALNLIRAGEMFGEIALLDGKVRTADAVAFLSTTVMVIDRRDFLHALREEPDLGLKLLAIMSDRLRRTSQQVEDISFVDWPSRLAKAILSLAEVQGVLSQETPWLRMTQKELGQTIGLSRESTNRQLREWEAAGLLTLAKGGFFIHRLSRLRRLAGATSEDADAR
jgi:CRP-like cAMP-binding protein